MWYNELDSRVEALLKLLQVEYPDEPSTHQTEDALLWDFVRHVAGGRSALATRMAQRLLDIDKIDRVRWYE